MSAHTFIVKWEAAAGRLVGRVTGEPGHPPVQLSHRARPSRAIPGETWRVRLVRPEYGSDPGCPEVALVELIPTGTASAELAAAIRLYEPRVRGIFGTRSFSWLDPDSRVERRLTTSLVPAGSAEQLERVWQLSAGYRPMASTRTMVTAAVCSRDGAYQVRSLSQAARDLGRFRLLPRTDHRPGLRAVWTDGDWKSFEADVPPSVAVSALGPATLEQAKLEEAQMYERARVTGTLRAGGHAIPAPLAFADVAPSVAALTGLAPDRYEACAFTPEADALSADERIRIARLLRDGGHLRPPKVHEACLTAERLEDAGREFAGRLVRLGRLVHGRAYLSHEVARDHIASASFEDEVFRACYETPVAVLTVGGERFERMDAADAETARTACVMAEMRSILRDWGAFVGASRTLESELAPEFRAALAEWDWTPFIAALNAENQRTQDAIRQRIIDALAHALHVLLARRGDADELSLFTPFMDDGYPSLVDILFDTYTGTASTPPASAAE